MKRKEKVFGREEILEKVWGYEYYGDIRTVDVTIRRIREKIEKNTPEFLEMPLAQTLTTTQGDVAQKANPAVQEFRALVRDYAAALKTLRDIKGNQPEEVEASNLESIRSRFKVAK